MSDILEKILKIGSNKNKKSLKSYTSDWKVSKNETRKIYSQKASYGNMTPQMRAAVEILQEANAPIAMIDIKIKMTEKGYNSKSYYDLFNGFVEGGIVEEIKMGGRKYYKLKTQLPLRINGKSCIAKGRLKYFKKHMLEKNTDKRNMLFNRIREIIKGLSPGEEQTITIFEEIGEPFVAKSLSSKIEHDLFVLEGIEIEIRQLCYEDYRGKRGKTEPRPTKYRILRIN